MRSVADLLRLVDEITYKKASEATDAVTQSAILGPFFRHDAPTREKGSTITFNTPKDGQVAYMYGRVVDVKTKKPLANAYIDVWEASTNGNAFRQSLFERQRVVLIFKPGLYEQQDPDQEDCNLRGKFKTDENGEYAFYCLRPTPYPVPFDGPAGKILQLLDRHPFRPAHIHLIVRNFHYLIDVTWI